MAGRAPPPPLVSAAIEVLRPYAPFDSMREPDLAWLAARLKLRYFATGTTVLDPGHGPVAVLYIIQRGRVLGEDASGKQRHAEVLELSPGEAFPVGALIGARATTLRYVAGGDLFCYALEAAAFRELMERSAEFRRFCTGRMATLLGQSHALLARDHAAHATGELALSASLGEVVRRAPVTLAQSESVGKALSTMKSRGIGSIVLTAPDGAPSGILTRSDVLDRIALARLPLEGPVSEVMTRDPVRLQATALAGDAAQLMAQHGFRHLLVMEGARLAGVVSERDLFALQRRSIQGLRKEIARAPALPELVFAAREVRALSASMLAQGVGAEALTQLVTTLNDAIVERAVALAQHNHDLASIKWCWLGLGSEGRREQTLATDQDNALVYEAPAGVDVTGRLLAFADEVNRSLDAAGFPLCRGDIMARNPLWCLALPEWQERFDTWIRNPEPKALLNAAIFFDFRALAGEATIAARLREFLSERAAQRPAFLRQLAVNALETRPPLGTFGDLVVDGGTIDLKLQGTRPFVDAARVLALAHGVAETSTAGRLRQSAVAARLPADEAESAVEAFHFVQMLRLRHQEAVARDPQSNPNRIDPRDLHALHTRILKEALRQARKLQNRIALDYQL